MAIASVAILSARTRPILLALACWAALCLCVALRLLPAGAGLSLGAALLAAVLSDRMPALAWALFAWLASVAAGWTMIRVAPVPSQNIAETLVHTAAALSAWWMLAAALTRRWADRWAAEARAAFLMTATTAAIASLILLTYSAVGVTYWRLTQVFDIRPIHLPTAAWQGLIDIFLVILAAQLSRFVAGWPGLPVATLWLMVFAGTWWGLMLPPSSELTASRWPIWLTWLAWIQTTWSWSLLGAMLLWVWRGWQVQERAWPGDLGSLVRVAKPWPGLEPTATALGLVLVPLGLWLVFSTGPDGYKVARLTTWNMAAAALALSVLIGWHWSRTVAELSLALWTLSLAGLAATTAQQVISPRASIEQLPAVHTGVVAGLAGASLLWFWLARLWRQQLRDGRAWTTTGRMIPLAERVGFMAASLAVLVGAKLAMWPRMQYGSADNSFVRLVVGSVTYGSLMAICLWAGRPLRRSPMVWLSVMAGMTWGIFLWFRR
jgi:hypothetical protein